MTKPTINRQAENEQGADTDSKRKHKQVSKRDFIDASGNEVDTIEEAAGARYTLLVPAGNKVFNVQLGTPGAPATMFGILGVHTKIGNVANTILNDKDEPGDPDDAAAAIDEFLKQLEGGIWSERATGGVGTRVDKEALAAVMVTIREAMNAADGGKRNVDYASILAAFDDPKNVRAARSIPEVLAAYAERVGKPTKSLDDLAF